MAAYWSGRQIAVSVEWQRVSLADAAVFIYWNGELGSGDNRGRNGRQEYGSNEPGWRRYEDFGISNDGEDFRRISATLGFVGFLQLLGCSRVSHN